MAPGLSQQIADAFLPHPPGVLGVAVSGGGDSLALLHLLHDFCRAQDIRLHAITIDHGLRPEAAVEAGTVARICARLGVSHHTGVWRHWDGQGNLQNAARDARYGLIADWAHERGIGTVALGHTMDDQAETLLMRLSRRSGVNGLTGMAPRVLRNGVIWVRPLLTARRGELRDFLQQRGIEWMDDPSNEDTDFARIRARQALAHLEPLGIDAAALSDVAAQMAQARIALDWQTFLAARDLSHIDGGAVVLCERKLRILPDEIQRRLIVHAINWINGAGYPPRRGAIAALRAALRTGHSGTADGCHARRHGGNIWVFRELNAVKDMQSRPNLLWDMRWQMIPAGSEGDRGELTVRALGKSGLAQCPDWREMGRPHAMLLSSPAVWCDDIVVAAPLARRDQTWHAVIDGGEDTFFAALLSH